MFIGWHHSSFVCYQFSKILISNTSGYEIAGNFRSQIRVFASGQATTNPSGLRRKFPWNFKSVIGPYDQFRKSNWSRECELNCQLNRFNPSTV
jgi:hypothetical protein